MDAKLAELVRLLELEQLEDNIFRGESRDIGSSQVYGGQVLGQALRAAYRTVEPARLAHSLHAYFLRRGDFNAPIVYFVDRSRDGHSFSSRRVTAIQHGEQIFHLSASFQIEERGLEHQLDMPAVPPPEQLPEGNVLPPQVQALLPARMRISDNWRRPFEFRLIDAEQLASGGPAPAQQRLWLRAVDRLPDDPTLHHALLAYVSDFHLLSTATAPHAAAYLSGHLQRASIDHAMWFHRRLRIDEWLLYSIDSPAAAGGRGFARGSIYSRDGRLGISTAQEGLLRVIEGSSEIGT